MLRLIAIASIIAACGTDQANPVAQDTSVPGQQQGQEGQQQITSAMMSMAIADAGELPTCDDANDKQLVYAIAEQTFYTCQSGAWVSIDVKGADGKDGVSGKDGVAGKDGSNGKDGLAGAKGDTGAQGAAANPTDWTDPVTGQHWIMLMAANNALANMACPSGYSLPTAAVLSSAVQHGLYIAFLPRISLSTALECGQVSDAVSASSLRGAGACSNANTTAYGVYCVK